MIVITYNEMSIWKKIINMIFDNDEYEKEVDDYLKPRHYLMGTDIEMEINEEQPKMTFECSEPKQNKRGADKVVEIKTLGKQKKQKSNKLF